MFAPNHVTLLSIGISVVALFYAGRALVEVTENRRHSRKSWDWMRSLALGLAIPTAALWFVWSGTFREVTVREPVIIELPCASFYEAEDWDNYNACIENRYDPRFEREG